MDLPTYISRTSPFPILWVLGCVFLFIPNSEDPDQTQHYAMSVLFLYVA